MEMLSEYAGFLPRDGESLVVHCSHKDVEPGRFSQFKVMRDSGYPVLYVNCIRKTWYREGVPGLGSDPLSTAEAIRNFAERRGFKRIACVGFSMGGYGALLYGALTKADVIVSLSGEAVLNYPFSRSATHLQRVPSVYDSVLPLLEGRDRNATHAVAGEAEPSDMLQAAFVDRIGRGHMVADCSHGTLRQLHNAGLFNGFIADLIEGREPTAPILKPFPSGWAEPMGEAPDPGALREAYRRLYKLNPTRRLRDRLDVIDRRIRHGLIWADPDKVDEKAIRKAAEKPRRHASA